MTQTPLEAQSWDPSIANRTLCTRASWRSEELTEGSINFTIAKMETSYMISRFSLTGTGFHLSQDSRYSQDGTRLSKKLMISRIKTCLIAALSLKLSKITSQGMQEWSRSSMMNQAKFMKSGASLKERWPGGSLMVLQESLPWNKRRKITSQFVLLDTGEITSHSELPFLTRVMPKEIQLS